MMMMMMIVLLNRSRKKKCIPLSQRLTQLGKRMRRRRLDLRALGSPLLSPFVVLFHSKCDQSIIIVAGVDQSTFVYLLKIFRPMYKRYTPCSSNGLIKILPLRQPVRGRPRSMDAMQFLCLDLLHGSHRTRGSMLVLNLLFRMADLVCKLFNHFASRLLLKALSTDAYVKIRMPTTEESKQYEIIIDDK